MYLRNHYDRVALYDITHLLEESTLASEPPLLSVRGHVHTDQVCWQIPVGVHYLVEHRLQIPTAAADAG